MKVMGGLVTEVTIAIVQSGALLDQDQVDAITWVAMRTTDRLSLEQHDARALWPTDKLITTVDDIGNSMVDAALLNEMIPRWRAAKLRQTLGSVIAAGPAHPSLTGL